MGSHECHEDYVREVELYRRGSRQADRPMTTARLVIHLQGRAVVWMGREPFEPYETEAGVDRYLRLLKNNTGIRVFAEESAALRDDF